MDLDVVDTASGKKGSVKLPLQFEEQVRPDLIRKPQEAALGGGPRSGQALVCHSFQEEETVPRCVRHRHLPRSPQGTFPSR